MFQMTIIRSVLPKNISFVRHRKKYFPNGSKLDSSNSVLDILKRSKRKSQRLLDKLCPDFRHFQILFYNFVYNVKAHNQTVWQTYFLNPC